MEIQRIETFGRNRIPQLLANSTLHVMPGTSMEKRLLRDNLLMKQGLNRCFIFKDRQVESIHVALNTFVRQNMPQDISNLPAIDKLKDEEWQYLNTLIRLY